jgi:hypothetical protein
MNRNDILGMSSRVLGEALVDGNQQHELRICRSSTRRCQKGRRRWPRSSPRHPEELQRCPAACLAAPCEVAGACTTLWAAALAMNGHGS